MTLLAFVAQHKDTVVTAPGGLGGECVDLVNLYLLEVLNRPLVRANAADWPAMPRPGLRWVPNAPTNFPVRGAVVVWGQSASRGIGPNGHIAVVLLADVMWLVTLDQNWPEGAPVGFRQHDYAGVLGWFMPG